MHLKKHILTLFALTLISGTFWVFSLPGQGGWGTAPRTYPVNVWCGDGYVQYTVTSCETSAFDYCYPSSVPAYPCFAGSASPDS